MKAPWQLQRLFGVLILGLALMGGLVHADPSTHPVVQSSGDPLPFVEMNRAIGGPCSKGRCADLHLRLPDFEQHPAFTQFLDRLLASMAWSPDTRTEKFVNLEQLSNYFERHASPSTSEYLQANVLRNQSDLVVVDLVHYIFTGGAHGDTTSQYINWLPLTNRVVSLETMLLSGAMPQYLKVLREQHEAWLKEQGSAIDDMQSFVQMWPFKPSDNAALMPDGLRVTYDRYVIGPGSFGQPSFVIPYGKLKDVIAPEFLEAALR